MNILSETDLCLEQLLNLCFHYFQNNDAKVREI